MEFPKKIAEKGIIEFHPGARIIISESSCLKNWKYIIFCFCTSAHFRALNNQYGKLWKKFFKKLEKDFSGLPLEVLKQFC